MKNINASKKDPNYRMSVKQTPSHMPLPIIQEQNNEGGNDDLKTPGAEINEKQMRSTL